MIRVTVHIETTDCEEQTSLDFLAVIQEIMSHVEADGIGTFFHGGLHKVIGEGSEVRAVLNATLNLRGVPQ